MTSIVICAWTSQLEAVYIRGRRVRYLDAGDGPAIVLLHGIPTHSYLWRDVVSFLQHEFRVIAPDLPGFGFSDRPGPDGLTPASMALAISTMLENLGVGEYGLVGHDYGALVACELLRTQSHQITSLTLTNTSLWREDWSGSSGLNPLRLLKYPVTGELALAVARPFMLRYAFRIYVSDRRRLTDETMELYWYPFTRQFRKTLLQLYRSNALDEGIFAGWRNAVRVYDGPAQVVWGMQDPTFIEHTGRAIAQLLQHGSFTGLGHSNHFVPEDRPQSLGRLIASIALLDAQR